MVNKFVLISAVFFCLAQANASYAGTNDNKIVDSITVGSITFNKVELENLTYVNEKTPDDKETSVEIKIYCPQIKDPKNPAQKEWNEYIKSIWPDISHAGCEGGTGNYEVDFSVNYASEHIISIFRNGWWHCPRASHGYSRNLYINTLLEKGSIKKLSMSELFNPDTDWKGILFEMAMKRLEFEAHTSKERTRKLIDYNKGRLQKRYNEGTLKYYKYDYRITPKGLRVSFGSVGGFMYGNFFADILWDEIGSYLSEDIKNYLPL